MLKKQFSPQANFAMKLRCMEPNPEMGSKPTNQHQSAHHCFQPSIPPSAVILLWLVKSKMEEDHSSSRVSRGN